MRNFFSILLLLLTLSSCGSLPRPFETYDDVSTLAHVPRQDEVLLLNISGVFKDQNQLILDSLEKQLSKRQFISHREVSESLETISPSLKLKGHFTLEETKDDEYAVTFKWNLQDKQGQSLWDAYSKKTISKAKWQEDADSVLLELANEKTAGLLAFLKTQQAEIPQSEGDKIKLYFAPILSFDKAEPIKEQILRVYMSKQIMNLDLEIVASKEEADYALQGRLDITPQDDKEVILVTWTILSNQNDKEVFSIKQSNLMPQGAFLKGWNRNYRFLGTAAVNGMSKALQQLPSHNE